MNCLNLRALFPIFLLALFALSFSACKSTMEGINANRVADLGDSGDLPNVPDKGDGGGDLSPPEIPLTALNVINVRRCSLRHTGFAIYNGNENRAQNLRFLITNASTDTFPRAFMVNNLMSGMESFGYIDGEFEKSYFESTGNPRFPGIEGRVITVGINAEKLAAIKANVPHHYETTFALYYDKDESGTLTEGDPLLGTNTGRQPPDMPGDGTVGGLSHGDGATAYGFQIMSTFYNLMDDGCNGDEATICHRCDEILSPLVVDVKGNGFDLTNKDRGVFFDIEASGKKPQIGWTAARSDDAFIALDRNSNGIIDDGSELFGTATVRKSGLLANNGFDALKDLDTNFDGVIDKLDDVFSELHLWLDFNHNGYSEIRELYKLSRFIEYIELNYKITNITDEHGNMIFAKSKIHFRNGNVRDVADIWFVTK